MRQGGFAAVLLGFVLLIAVPGAAETFQEEVAGHTATVYVLETETTHNHFETSTTEFTYHREARTSGAWVDDQGANATVTNTSRSISYENGPYSSDRSEESAGVTLEGEAAGFTTYQRAEVALIERSFDFGEDLNGDARHVLVSYDGRTYSEETFVGTAADGDVGAGHLVTPAMGDVYFLNGGASTGSNVRSGDTLLAAGGSGGHDTFAGDWTGSHVSANVYEVHCQGFDCQYTSVGESLCLLGYRPPFFLECGI